MFPFNLPINMTAPFAMLSYLFVPHSNSLYSVAPLLAALSCLPVLLLFHYGPLHFPTSFHLHFVSIPNKFRKNQSPSLSLSPSHDQSPLRPRSHSLSHHLHSLSPHDHHSLSSFQSTLKLDEKNMKMKTKEKEKETISSDRYRSAYGYGWKVVGIMIWNCFVLFYPIVCLSSHIIAYTLSNPYHHISTDITIEFPSFSNQISSFVSLIHSFLFKSFMLILLEEFVFYGIHRVLHIPFLYSRIHSVHHSSRAPTAIIGLYAHPIEFFLMTTSSLIFVPAFILNRLDAWIIWQSFATFNILFTHSGFQFQFQFKNKLHHKTYFSKQVHHQSNSQSYISPLIHQHGEKKDYPSKGEQWMMHLLEKLAAWSQNHDLHHEFIVGNYGLIGLCDFIFQTSIISPPSPSNP